MQGERKPSPSELRMEELCAIREPLTECEASEVLRLKARIIDTTYQRTRYANDEAYRNKQRARRNARYRRQVRMEAAE